MQFCRQICSWAYDNNVKSVYGPNVDCSEFIQGIYANIVDSISAHEQIFVCGMYVTFEGYICCRHMYGNSKVKRSCNLFVFTCM